MPAREIAKDEERQIIMRCEHFMQLDILRLLSEAEKGMMGTNLMVKCRLNSNMLRKYIDPMIEFNLIEKIPVYYHNGDKLSKKPSTRKALRITKQGIKTLATVDSALKLLPKIKSEA